MLDDEMVKKVDEIGKAHVFPLNLDFGCTFGLTKRELFAMVAMQGFCASADHRGPDSTAVDAVRQAEALIKALEYKE